jgi:hypothetical protein
MRSVGSSSLGSNPQCEGNTQLKTGKLGSQGTPAPYHTWGVAQVPQVRVRDQDSVKFPDSQREAGSSGSLHKLRQPANYVANFPV